MASRLVALTKQIKREHNPDYLFIEPSEMVVTKEIRDVTAMGLRDTRYEVGPLITLVNGPDFEFLWAERHRLIQGQMHDADLVAISRAESLSAPKLDHIRTTLDGCSVAATPLDTRQNYGMEVVWEKIVNPGKAAG